MKIKALPQTTFWADPEWYFVEGRRSQNVHACYQAHTHPTFSIGIVDEGRSLFSHHTQAVALRAGSIVMVGPDEVHACNPAPGEAWSYRMFHIDAAWLRALWRKLGMPAALINQTHGVLHDAALNAQLDTLTQWLSVQSGLPAVARIAELEHCLAAIYRRASTLLPQQTAASKDPRILKALQYLAVHQHDAVSLPQLARAAGASPWHLVRLFRRELGLTPHAWLIDQRVNRARVLIRAHQPLADVAVQTGFADQAHLQRAFKRHVAATPGQYRQIPGLT